MTDEVSLAARPGVDGSVGEQSLRRTAVVATQGHSRDVSVCLQTSTGKAFRVIALFENDVEITLYQHGGLLNFVARKFS